MKYNKVSVIVPVYNMERYLAESLESILQSDYPDFEVIVVDDGSADASYSIAERFAEKDSRIRVYKQTNSGASSARNNAISKAQGMYILPVDADNLISAQYISHATRVLDNFPDVKLVSSEAEFIGEKSGKWQFKPFSINLLCRKNLVDNCSMYRKTDWVDAGGYCNKLLGREDWDFWLSLFETGGEFVRLPIVGLYYRIRPDSKRVRTRHLYKSIIDALNARHKPLFYKELRGKLHYQRTFSKLINTVISWFRPHNVYADTSDFKMEKLVYAANETDFAKDFLNIDKDVVRYIAFKENRLHIPGTKIRNSKARQAFDVSDKTHLGYYEEQVSPLVLSSYLIVKV